MEMKRTKEMNQDKNSDNLGLDPEEQAMNGLYGMVETNYENSLHIFENVKNKQK